VYALAAGTAAAHAAVVPHARLPVLLTLPAIARAYDVSSRLFRADCLNGTQLHCLQLSLPDACRTLVTRIVWWPARAKQIAAADAEHGQASPSCSNCKLRLLLYIIFLVNLQEVGDKERLVASLTEQIAAADAEHAQAKARRNEALDARKAAWQEVDGLKEEHQAAEAEYNKAFEVRDTGYSDTGDCAIRTS
jgi:hypothetical protein